MKIGDSLQRGRHQGNQVHNIRQVAKQRLAKMRPAGAVDPLVVFREPLLTTVSDYEQQAGSVGSSPQAFARFSLARPAPSVNVAASVD